MGAPLRVIVQQPACTRYRVPVFSALADRDGLDMELVYGEQPGVPNVEPEGFPARFEPMKILRLPKLGDLYWHAPQWRPASGRERNQAVDVLVLTWNSRFLSLIPALWRARRNGVGTVLWGHGVSKTEKPWSLWMRKRIGEMADAVMFYNNEQASRFIDLGWDAERVFVALNSLNQQPIQAARRAWLDDPQRLAAFRSEHGLDQGPTLLFVSRLDPERRLDVLLRAMPDLIDAHPDTQLIVVGKGPDRERLDEICASLDIADRVRFVGAIYDEMELAPWYLSADVFAFPAHMGLSLLHAFGYGVPVVTSGALERHGPEVEAMENGVNGLFFDDGDSASMARAIGELLDDPTRRVKMGEAAHNTVLESFSIERMVDGMENAIRYADSRRSGRGGRRRKTPAGHDMQNSERQEVGT